MNSNTENNYLKNIPLDANKYGISKILMVRHLSINIKHIFTEIFVRKTVNIEESLKLLNMDMFKYIEYMTNKLRRIYKIPRSYRKNPNNIVDDDKNSFFRGIELFEGMKNLIILDFDGVVTSKNFEYLYELCIKRCKTVICSANPTIVEDYFIKRNISLPSEIHSLKGKKHKIKKILDLNLKYDNVFYIDNEIQYLNICWIFGVKTYHWTNNKIMYYSLNSK